MSGESPLATGESLKFFRESSICGWDALGVLGESNYMGREALRERGEVALSSAVYLCDVQLTLRELKLAPWSSETTSQ